MVETAKMKDEKTLSLKYYLNWQFPALTYAELYIK